MVGRAPGSDIRLASPIVSRYHPLLRRTTQGWVLIDLDSLNGTTVNGQPVSAPRALRPDDVVNIADTRLVFRCRARPGQRAAPAGPVATVAGRTRHFQLFAQPDSFAAYHHEVVAERLERACAELVEILAIPELDAPIDVYLLDELLDPARPDALLPAGGYVDARRRAIFAVDRADSPGVDLEECLLALVRQLAFGDAPPWPASVSTGVLLFVQQRAGLELPAGDVRAAAEAAQQGSLPALRVLLSGAESADPRRDSLAVASLLDELTGAYGMPRVARFLRQLGAVAPDAAARAAFGRPLAALEKRWHKDLRRGAAGGARLFVGLVLPYLRPYRFKLAEISFYLLLSVAFGIGLARAQGLLLDEALIPGDRRMFVIIMSVLAAAFAITNLTSLRDSFLRARVAEGVIRDLRLRMFTRLQALHPGYFARTESGDLIARLTNDLFMIEAALTSGLVETLRLAMMFVLALATILVIDWRLALVSLVGTPLFFLVGRLLGPPIARASIVRQQQFATVTSAIHENLAAQPVIKLYGLQRLAIGRFERQLDALFRTSQRMYVLAGTYSVLSSSTASVIELAVLGIGAYLVLEGNLTAGALFTFLFLSGQVVGPVQSISNLLALMQRATGSMLRVRELADAEPALRDAPDAAPLGRLAREVRLERVTFSYDESRRILEDVSLSVPAGASVAIVGPSGSGKSTVLNLLARFYDPRLGRVLVDGVDLKQATLESVRGQIGMVFQETVLFNASIRENIRLGNPAASDDEVEAAARAAELHDLITQLPDGYETLVGERGGLLSGGQRQRVAIARAILRDPALLLLDEATSALDPATEAAINATLRRIAAGRTTISVTHRLASVAGADRIVVLDQGRLVEQGTHQELLAAEGLYARLWEDQHGPLDGPGTGEAIPALERIPLFAGLDRAVLGSLAGQLAAERHAPGATIVAAGAPGDRLYIVEEGEVEVLAPDTGGTPQRLALLGAGDYFGEIALLHDVPRTATVRARTSVQLLTLDRARFQDLLAASPHLAAAVAQTAATREAALRELAGPRPGVRAG
jgi:ATP-binding cassette subfamily B protein